MVSTFKKYIIFSVTIVMVYISTSACYANHYDGDSTLFTNTYNNKIYSSVIDAAKTIARPFLLQQAYMSASGITVVDTSLIFNGVTYPVSQTYNINRSSGFYIPSAVYGNYGINNFKVVWPTKFPNIDFNIATKTFNSQVDCVGYGTRVLSAVGDTTINGNAYASLVNQVTIANVADMPPAGRAADSYQLATAFATLNTVVPVGWQYISGNVLASYINTYNHTFNANLNTYTGVRKGGFAASKAGDILAFGNGPNASATGHTMIIDTTPVLLNTAGLKTFFPNQTNNDLSAFIKLHPVYAVSILDDCDIKHFKDSRTTISGIGHGTLLIVTDTLDDAPIGYVFAPKSTLSFTPVDTSKTYAITVARYISAAQLPVTFRSFTATNKNNSILLNWQTGIETNTALFSIQRSVDATDFTTIGIVTAMNKNFNEYSFYDNSLPIMVDGSLVFYRIVSVDKDGKTSFSDVRTINLQHSTPDFTVFPNPVLLDSRINIVCKGMKQVRIMNCSGQTIQQLNNTTEHQTINTKQFTKGLYIVQVATTNGEIKTQKLIVE